MHSCGVRTLFIIFIGTPKRAPRVQLSTILGRVSTMALDMALWDSGVNVHTLLFKLLGLIHPLL